MKQRGILVRCCCALAIVILSVALCCLELLNEYGEVYAADPETVVLFETNFENYTSGAEIDPSGAVELRNANNFELAQDKDGNKGMRVTSGAPQIHYTLPQAVTSGVLYVTFDIEVTAEMDPENGSAGSYLSLYGDEYDSDGNPVDDRNKRKYVFYMKPNSGFIGPCNNLVNWGDANNNPIAYSANTRYNIQAICDLTNKHHYTYVNGELLSDVGFSSATYFNEISKLSFVFQSSDVTFFDNLRISYMTDTSFTGKLQNAQIEENRLLFRFSEGISLDSAFADAVIKNTFTGETITVLSITNRGRRELAVEYSGDLLAGDRYELLFPSGLTNALGRPLGKRIFFNLPGEDGKLYITAMQLIDCDGEIHYPDEELVRPIRRAELTFSDNIDTSCVAYIDTGEFTFNATLPAENIICLDFDEYFLENGEYYIRVDENMERIAKPYEFSFKTGEGVVEIRSFGFTRDGESVDGTMLSAGDRLVLNAEIVKTKREAIPMILSYSRWNRKEMNGFNFVDMSLEENDTYVTKEIEVVVENVEGFAVKGFLRRGPWLTNPLTEHVELRCE